METRIVLLSFSFLSYASLISADECEREILGAYANESGGLDEDTERLSDECIWDFETPNGFVIMLIVFERSSVKRGYCIGTTRCNRIKIDINENLQCDAVFHQRSCISNNPSVFCNLRWKNNEIRKLKNNSTMSVFPGWVLRNGHNVTYKYGLCSNESNTMKVTTTSVSTGQSPIMHLISQNATQPSKILLISQNASTTANWTPADKTSETEFIASDLRVATIIVSKAFFYGILATACTLAVILLAVLLRYLAKKCDGRCRKIIRNSGFESQTEEKIPDAIYDDVTQGALPRSYYEEIAMLSNSRAAYEVIHGDAMQEEIVLTETPGYQAVMLDEAQTDGGYEIVMRSAHSRS